MARRTTRRRPVGKHTRRRQAVEWLNTPHSPCIGDAMVADGLPHFLPLEITNNPFITMGSTRFSNENDELVYLRIVGRIRIGLYWPPIVDPQALLAIQPSDQVVSAGLILLKGEYDAAGNWSTNATIPSIEHFEDDPDKWLWRDQWVMNMGHDFTVNPDPLFPLQPTGVGGCLITASCRTNDFHPPNGSFVDVKPKRKAQYEEKLGIIYSMCTLQQDGVFPVAFMNHNLRVLTAKWR